MKLRMRVVLLSLLCVFCVCGGAKAAESSGYIFRLAESAVVLSDGGGLPEGVDEVYAPEGLFRTDDAGLIQELEEAGLLAYAEPDWVVTLLDVPDDPGYTNGDQWELSALHMDYAWNNGITGKQENGTPVRIGVVDSGVFAAHEDLNGTAIISGTNYCVSADSAERSDVSDSVGHGTFITGILAAATGNGVGVAGLAPQAEIVPLKCFKEKDGTISDIVAAIYGGVDDYHCQVLNMSFGTSKTSSALEEAIAHAAAEGVILVAAAGNAPGGSTGNDPVQYPAGFETVIGVGSVDRGKAISKFSYQNDSVYITAPGQGLYGLGIASGTTYVTGQGTSYAAPMVSAAAALALSIKPELTPAEFRSLLRDTAEDLGEPGWDTVYGHGLLDIGGLLEILVDQWRLVEQAGERTLVVRMTGLVPDSSVWLVQTVHNSVGAQSGVSLTEKITAADGSLRCALPLMEIDGEETMLVLVLDSAFRPLREGWSPVNSQAGFAMFV